MSWGNTYKSSLTKISTKCLRNMFFAYSRESATPYYNLMEILKFDLKNLLHQLWSVYMVKLLPLQLQKMVYFGSVGKN